MHPSPDVLALLALGEEAGTPAERDHVGTCRQCQAEVTELGRAVVAGRGGRAGDSGMVTPPDRVWAAIRTELGFSGASASDAAYGTHGLREVATRTALPRRVESNGSTPDEAEVEQLPRAPEPSPRRSEPSPRTPEVADLDAARRRSSRGRRAAALMAAAAVALVLGLGLGLGLDRILGPRQTTLWTAELQALPEFAGASGRALVQEDDRGNRTLLIEVDNAASVDGSQQVWLIDRDGQRMRSLGYLTRDSNQFEVPADLDPRELPVVDVSEEPRGDTDVAHSKVSIIRGTLNV